MTVPTHPDCQLSVGPFFQCCCTCIYRVAIHYHCTTHPKPSPEQMSAAGLTGPCVCGVQKGWACANPEMDRVYDNWPEHSCGCECHTTKEEAAKHAAWTRKAQDFLFRSEHPNAPRYREAPSVQLPVDPSLPGGG